MKIVCVVKNPSDLPKFMEFCRSKGLIVETVGLPRHALVTSASIDEIRQLSFIKTAEFEREIPPDYQSINLPADLGTGGQSWALPRTIRRRPPWRTDYAHHPINTFFECARDGSGVDIYMFDTGVRFSHVEFEGRAHNVYEYSSPGADGDDNGHGTGGASCAAGASIGIARGASVRSCKISISSNGSATDASIISGLGAALTDYNSRNNPAVGNVSYSFNSSAMLDAISDVIDAGMLIVGSAGNDGVNLDSSNAYPAEAPDAVSVAAIDLLDRPAVWTNGLFTNYGSTLDICSPGHYYPVASHTGNSDYRRSAAGTSFAAAYTTGVIACMLQGHAKLTGRTQVQAVKAALLDNATTGRLTIPENSHVPSGGLPDRILYLDPTISAPESIPGL